ncbi:ribokinase [Actinosynnema sp. NPDC020468]|uniref:ribokinase n=1 Tax=Actinosynnema sp. NPDC020468 TaxID=3154488 RepID=UPI0033C27761
MLVLGSANADLVVSVPRRPGPGETVLGGDTAVLPGGKGANTAVAAARLGADVRLLGAVGDDAFGRLLRGSLAAAGVDLGLLRTVDRPTGLAHIAVTPDGENSIVVAPGANAALEPSDVDGVDWAGVDVLVCSLEVPVDVVAHAVRLAARNGVRPVLNLSPVVALPDDVVALLDPVVVNEHEAALLGPTGARATIVTLGARGAEVDGRRVAAPAVEVVDTTGAGDAFTGALAVGLAGGADPVAAARFAVRVAALSVTARGAQPSYPDRAAVDRAAHG